MVSGVVTLADGTQVQISAPDQASLIAKAREMTRPKVTSPTKRSTELATPDVIKQFGARRLINTILSTPSAAGELLAITAAGFGTAAKAGVDLLTGQPTNILEDFAALRESEGQRFPASALKAIPSPTATDIISAGQSFAIPRPNQPSFSERFQENKERQTEFLDTLREENPIAATVGEVGADAALLVAGRLPIAKGIQRIEKRLANPSKLDLPPGLSRVIDDALKSKSMRKLARGAGRSVETGLEAAVVSALGDGDPVSASFFAAGAQAGGSLGLSASKALLSGGPLKIGAKLSIAAAGTFGLIQGIKSITPGGDDSVIASAESAFNKVALVLALGMVSGIVGAGRGRSSQLAENLPKTVDAIASSLRGISLSGIKELTRDDVDLDTISLITRKLINNPDFFGPTAGRRLLRAMTTEAVSLSDEIEKLLREKRFREKVDELAK